MPIRLSIWPISNIWITWDKIAEWPICKYAGILNTEQSAKISKIIKTPESTKIIYGYMILFGLINVKIIGIIKITLKIITEVIIVAWKLFLKRVNMYPIKNVTTPNIKNIF